MRYQGRITSWKDDKGFGFITPNMGGDPVFVHIKAFTSRQRRPAENAIVTFDLISDAKGRPQAQAVAYVDERRTARTAPSGPSKLPTLTAGLFLVFMAFLALTSRLPLAVLGIYIGTSLLTFIAYYMDKSAARNGDWRTQESTLHLLAIMGGWPGALVAQNRLRHKSRKISFQLVFWATVLMNCGALGWLLSANGKQLLRSVLGTA